MVTCLLLAMAALLWPRRQRSTGAAPGRSGLGPIAAAPTVARPDSFITAPLAMTVMAAAVVAVAALVVAGPAALLASAALLATGFFLVRRALEDRRRRAKLADIVVGLRMLGRELRSGADLDTAAFSAATAARGAGAEVLESLAQLHRVDDAAGAAVPAGSDDPRAHAQARLRSGWLLTRRFGLAFTPLVDALAVDLSEQIAADAERAGQVAGPRMSGYVMAVLPVMGLALGAGMGADPIRVLVATPVGNVLLLVGVALTCVGLLWSARIVRR